MIEDHENGNADQKFEFQDQSDPLKRSKLNSQIFISWASKLEFLS